MLIIEHFTVAKEGTAGKMKVLVVLLKIFFNIIPSFRLFSKVEPNYVATFQILGHDYRKMRNKDWLVLIVMPSSNQEK